MKIYGAGIAGMLAGNLFQNAEIFEAGPEGQIQHKALLRFRSTAVADAVGIEFRKVRVHKGIFFDNGFVQPNIALANAYSKKVIGRLSDRSIWNLDPVDRFIAPEDFITQLAERCKRRIHWGHALTSEEIFRYTGNAISTLPMGLMNRFRQEHFANTPLAEFSENQQVFSSKPILVKRWRIKDADVFQTVYFPQDNTNLFRASITGDLLIAEYMVNDRLYSEAYSDNLLMNAFGIEPEQMEAIEKVKQGFGKIAPLEDDGWRKNFIHELSTNHKIYSLGRFGTWRNILIDDVIKDISVIKKLMTANAYERSKINSK